MNKIRRRSFLAQAGGLGALALVCAAAPRRAGSDPLGMPIGIQLWSVKDALQADPAGTLQKLRQIGYRNVETAGFAGLSAREFRQLVDAAGLKCPSAHLDFMHVEPEALFEAAHSLGAQYAVASILRVGSGATPELSPALKGAAGVLKGMTLDDARKTAELANRIGAQAKKTGLQFAYHNHFFEFVDMGGGAIAYYVLLRETDPDLVKFQIDCGWMKISGYDPVDYLHKYPGRFPMLHVKDFEPTTDPASKVAPGLRVGTELGRGFIDYKPIFAAARAAGLKYYFAEQEGPFEHLTPLEAAKVSYGYLHSMRV